MPDLGLSRKKAVLPKITSPPQGNCIQRLINAGYWDLVFLPQLTILEGHPSFRISENVYCDCITAQFLPTLPSSANLTLYRCVSWEHPTKTSTYQSQNPRACVLEKPTCEIIKLRISLKREKGGWDLGQEWEKVNRQSIILFSVTLFFYCMFKTFYNFYNYMHISSRHCESCHGILSQMTQ